MKKIFFPTCSDTNIELLLKAQLFQRFPAVWETWDRAVNSLGDGGRCTRTCTSGNAHLQCGQHYLLHRGEVGLPQELRLLPEGQDLILVDGAHRGRDLQTTNSSQAAQPGSAVGAGGAAGDVRAGSVQAEQIRERFKVLKMLQVNWMMCSSRCC